jgi:hypothetical protein
VFLISCEHDFIEDDLTGKTVTILAPADLDTANLLTPLFWWNEISGARSYRLQIVYPNFYSPQQLLYDTAVETDRFIPTLLPGFTYEWRIRPENGSSEGNWVTRTLTIDSSIGLSNQTIVITLPAANGTSSSSSSVSFSWNGITGATLYRVEINNVTTGANAVNSTTTLTNYTTTLAQGSYEFRVRAENSSSITDWSTRTFSIDQTAPAAPSLIFPADDASYSTVPSSVAFDWSSSLDAYVDSLEVSPDSLFSTGVVLRVAVSALQSTYVWNSAQVSTTYFWRIRSIDLAGNRSNYSSVFKFIVN